MGLPSLRHERPRFPLIPVLIFVVPALMTLGAMKYLQSRTIHELRDKVVKLGKEAKEAKDDNDRQAKTLARLERQVGALQAISKVEIVWGGSATADPGKVTFPYQHSAGSGVWV